MKNGCSIVKESAVAGLAAVVEAAKDTFIPYLDEAYKLIILTYNTHTAKHYL